MIPLLILALALLTACDELPASGGNTGAYYYMRSFHEKPAKEKKKREDKIKKEAK